MTPTKFEHSNKTLQPSGKTYGPNVTGVEPLAIWTERHSHRFTRKRYGAILVNHNVALSSRNFGWEGRVMGNVIRAQFGDGPAQKLMDEIRAVIMQPAYNELRVCELVGVLTMLTYEMMERNKP
jgi:hypothetical protein